MADPYQILNPMTPLAYLQPEVANQSRISVYIIISSAGAFIWDIISNIHSDYRLLFQHRIAFPTLVYFLSRLAVLASTTVNILFRAAPLGISCKNFQTAACVLYHMAFSSTTLLFFLRVRAIFNRNKLVVAFFFLLWVAVLGGTMTVAFSGGAKMLNPTEYCVGVPIQPYVAASPITLVVNDTCVFLAISWRLLSTSWTPIKDKTASSKLGHLVLGRNLPAFSRALFHDGQAYYLVSIISNILAVITVTLPSVPSGYRFMYVFNCVIANMMACRVYRHTKFGIFREDALSTTCIHALGRITYNHDSESNPVIKLAPNPDEKTTSDAYRYGATTGDTGNRSERLRSRLILGSIVFIMIFVPVLCVSICMRRRHGMK